MCGKDGVYGIAICLGLIFILVSIAPAADVDRDIESTVTVSEPAIGNVIVAGEPHDPIAIDGDANFTTTASNEGWLGNGSSENPFVINGLDIDRGGLAGHCINITNTRANFTISNCNLTGATGGYASGISLVNVTYGEISGNLIYNNSRNIYLSDAHLLVIKNNTAINSTIGILAEDASSNNIFEDNNCSLNLNFGIQLVFSGSNNLTNNDCFDNEFYGINMFGSNMNNLVNNTCNNNVFSIYLSYCDSNNLVNNTCYDNDNFGIYLYYADSNNLTMNTCYDNDDYGIYLRYSYYNTISNSTVFDNSDGIRIYQCGPNNLTDNICYNNTNHGIYLYRTDFNNLTGNTCYNNTFFGIRIRESDSNNLINNTCYVSDSYGIYLLDSYSNTVLNNTVLSNFRGIILDNSDSNNLTMNTCNDNDGYGIYLTFSSFNNLTMNTCYDNDEYGIILLVSNSNNITWNECSGNNVNVYDAGTGNLFDYNYWSDYVGDDLDENGVGDTPYTFTGNQDSHPLIAPPGSPPIWLHSLSDHAILIEELFRYDLNASAYGGLDHWWVNDTANFAISQSGVVTNDTFLPGGTYALAVYVNDTYGKVLIGTFTVAVSDTDSPTWIESPTTQVLEFGSDFYYNLNASDFSGLDDWWINDTANFAISQSGVITINIFLPAGTYGLTVYVNDTSGNVLEGIFSVTVSDTTPPTWVELPANQVLECGSDFYYNLNATDLSGLDDWWINDTANFAISQSGVIINNIFLPAGTYGLTVYVNDTSGNVLEGTFFVSVSDTTPPTWVELPANQVLEFGSSFYYNLNASDFSELDKWWLNDTTQFTIDSNGIIVNVTSLPVGIYRLHVYVNDTSGHILDTSLTIEIIDTTPPNLLGSVTDQYLDYGENLEFQITAFDLSGIGQWSLNDTAHFAIDSLGFLTSISDLEPGQYGLDVTITDPYGNELSVVFTINVFPEPTTSTTTTTSDTTTSTSTTDTSLTTTSTLPGVLDPVLMIIIVVGSGGVAVIIIILLLKRRT